MIIVGAIYLRIIVIVIATAPFSRSYISQLSFSDYQYQYQF